MLTRTADANGVRVTLGNSLPFYDFDVAVSHQVRESIDPRRRSGPMYFKPIQVAGWTQTQNFARIMGREIASATGLET